MIGENGEKLRPQIMAAYTIICGTPVGGRFTLVPTGEDFFVRERERDDEGNFYIWASPVDAFHLVACFKERPNVEPNASFSGAPNNVTIPLCFGASG